MMAGDGVCEAMAAAFESATGSLAERMLAALAAAEGMGGDARGRMSAALIVVEGTRHAHPWQGVLTDVRIDHHDDPLPELARLTRVAEAYHRHTVAEEALMRGDPAGALAASHAGLALLPDDGNLLFSSIAALIGMGRMADAATEVHKLVALRPSWEGILRALIDRGLVAGPEGLDLDVLLGRA